MNRTPIPAEGSARAGAAGVEEGPWCLLAALAMISLQSLRVEDKPGGGAAALDRTERLPL